MRQPGQDPDGSQSRRLSDSSAEWEKIIRGVGPASLLVVIDSRMSDGLRRHLSADDILQEALLHAWRDRHQYEWRGLKSFRAWLLAIADNRIRDISGYEGAQKRGGGEAPVSLSGTASAGSEDPRRASGLLLPFESSTPSRIALYKERAAAMTDALTALPDDLREVVRLRLFEQQSLEEIAKQLGIGANAAWHRFRKGAEIYRRRLKAALTSRAIPSIAAPVANPEKFARDDRGNFSPESG